MKHRRSESVLVQFECQEALVPNIQEELRKLGVRNFRLFEQKPVPRSPLEEQEFEMRAQRIAVRIAPRPNQPMRREVLQRVLAGHDTFHDQRGEVDPALRNGTGALSKALRPFADFTASPLDILCSREREAFSSGPFKGLYKGTRYRPTRLGRRVKEILEEKGWI